MSCIHRYAETQDGRNSRRRNHGDCSLRERRRVWRSAGLRTQTAVALDDRSTGMDIGNLFSHSGQDDLGTHTCSDLCLSDSLRLFRNESLLSYPSSSCFILRDPIANRLRKPFPGAWWAADPSGLFGPPGLSCSCDPMKLPRSSLLRRSSHFGYEGWKLRGVLRNSSKPLPSFAKATEGSPRLHPRSELRGIWRRRINKRGRAAPASISPCISPLSFQHSMKSV